MSDRTDFNRTWLTESPFGIGKYPTYEPLCSNIKSLIHNGFKPVTVKNNLKKIELENTVVYWMESHGKILLGCELYNMPQALVVHLTGKDPTLVKNKRPPYASDLYLAILLDTTKAIRLMSDKQISDEGFDLWTRLYNSGACVAVYCKNEKNAGQTYKLLNSLNDFKSYFSKTNRSMANYQYVITKKGSNALGESICHFGLRRARELAGVGVDDFDPNWHRIL